jgi:hypothetical protein
MTSFLFRTFCPLKLLLPFSLHSVHTKFSSSSSSYSLVIRTHDPGLYRPSIFLHPTLSQLLGNVSWLTGKCFVVDREIDPCHGFGYRCHCDRHFSVFFGIGLEGVVDV